MTPRTHSALRSTGRIIGIASVLMAFVSGASRTKAPAPAQPGDSATARINPEVRLRKLHLVRPDLIPYPIAYEVYC